MDKRDIIIDNYHNPYHKGLKEDNNYIKANMNNNACIDDIDVMVKFNKGVIEDIIFDGEACMIVISSTSILIKTLIGKTIKEAVEILNNYELMIEQKDYNKNILGELIVFDDIHRQPNRRTCALLSSMALAKILKNTEK